MLVSCVEDFKQRAEIGQRSRIITGAPGIGKTSLLLRLAEDIRSTQIVPVIIDGNDLNSAIKFTEALTSRLPIGSSDIATANKTTKEFGVSVYAGGRAIWEKNRASATERLLNGESVWTVSHDLLKQQLHNASKIVIMIDEAQAIEELTQGGNYIVRELQRGVEATGEFRIFPIFAGLLNVEAVLDNVGISRSAFRPIVLEALTTEQSMDAVIRFLRDETVGLKNVLSDRDRSTIAEVFAVASEGWPRHLHCYMTSLASRVAEDFSQPSPSTHLDFSAVLDNGHRERIAYSRSVVRRARLSQGTLSALVELANEKTIGSTFAFNEIREVRHRVVGNSTANNELEDELYQRATKAGLLQQSPTEGLSDFAFSIPSMHTFLVHNGKPTQTLNAMRRELDSRYEQFC